MSYDKKEWADFLDFIRLEKHWILNQFQVISGYIQIGKKEAAHEFIKKATAEVEGTSVFTKLHQQELAVHACFIWWKLRELNIKLFPIVNVDFKVYHTHDVLNPLETFLSDLGERYFDYLTEKHITWKLERQGNKVISTIKGEEDSKLPDLYTDITNFVGKINVSDNTITYILDDEVGELSVL